MKGKFSFFSSYYSVIFPIFVDRIMMKVLTSTVKRANCSELLQKEEESKQELSDMLKNLDMDLNDKIVIYRSADGETQLDVKIDKETVWLNVNQMAELFGRDSKTIRKHIDNAIREELANEVVVAKFATTTQHGAMVGKSQTHDVNFYNLDVIISVGYRVKSKNGIEFRRWANKVLKEYLVKGYAVNKALTEQRYTELKQLVAVLGRTVKAQEELTSDDALNLVEVVSDYTYALDTLDKSKVPCHL